MPRRSLRGGRVLDAKAAVSPPMKMAIFEVASGPPLCAHVVAEPVSVAASIVKALAYLACERALLARGTAPCAFRGVIIQPPLV
jgi:hypothetical protein